VDFLEQGRYGVLVGLIGNKEAATSLSEVTTKKKELDLNLLKLANILAR